MKDHLRDYIKGYLEPKSSASSRGVIEPVVLTVDDIKNVLGELEKISKGINKGLISIYGNDFLLVLEVEGGTIKDSLYRDEQGEVWGEEAIKRASTKTGRVRIRMCNVSVTGVLIRLSR